MIGTYVLAPQRVVPLAYTPGIVTGTRHGLVEVKMPHKDKFLFQCFERSQLILIDPPFPIARIN